MCMGSAAVRLLVLCPVQCYAVLPHAVLCAMLFMVPWHVNTKLGCDLRCCLMPSCALCYVLQLLIASYVVLWPITLFCALLSSCVRVLVTSAPPCNASNTLSYSVLPSVVNHHLS